MVCWNGSNAVDGVVDGRADEHVGAVPPGAELDLLAVDQDELAVIGQRAVRDDQVEPGGLAAAGFAAEQHVAFGQVDVDVLAVLIDAQVHRVEHGERERAGVGVVMVVCLLPGGEAGRAPGRPVPCPWGWWLGQGVTQRLPGRPRPGGAGRGWRR